MNLEYTYHIIEKSCLFLYISRVLCYNGVCIVSMYRFFPLINHLSTGLSDQTRYPVAPYLVHQLFLSYVNFIYRGYYYHILKIDK